MAPQKTKNQALRPSRRVWFSPHHSEEALRHRRRASYYTCTLLFAGGSVGAVRRVAGPSATAGTAACARITSGAGITPLFAGAIAVTTAYLLHIPIPTGGYIHLGDALIYLAACLLPAPYAVGAAMVGAGLADLLTAPLWVVPTLLIKALVALLFTSRGPRLLCPRNGAALLLACLLSPAAYGLAACLLLGGVNAFWPQFLGTLVQAVGSGAVFTVLALALDRAGGKARLAPHSQG